MLQLIAPAKLNLCLDVLEKISSGYHKIQTIFHATDQIHNKITLRQARQNKNQSIKNPLVKSAIQMLDLEGKVEIEIEQNIPFSSGLGGESSNAATVLKGLNQLFALNLPPTELLLLAKKLGMDVPFFLLGGTALGTNYGEELIPLPHIALPLEIQPKSANAKDKTAQAFAQLDLRQCGHNQERTKAAVKAIKAGDIAQLQALLHNDFETLYHLSPGFHLSGSGPSTFKILSAHSSPGSK